MISGFASGSHQGQSTVPGIEREFAFSEADFSRLRDFIRRHAGITIAPHKVDMVYGRVSRRLRTLGISRVSDYVTFLESPEGRDEIQHAVNALTTNLTRFYRENHHFTTLQHELERLKGAHQGHGALAARRLRLWSAGCSTGEEAYSMAMTVAAHFGPMHGWDVKVLGTDIDTSVLDRARAAVYSAAEVEPLPPYAKAYLQDVGGGKLLVRDDIRQMVTFNHLNLLDRWPMKGPFDVIFCRNVTIYFEREVQADLFRRFSDLLVPGGLLFIGHSEYLRDAESRFTPLGGTAYRRT